MLRLLKRSNANIDTLITVYTTIIRPALGYACQVWHYNIQQYLSEEIELKNLKTALRIILPKNTKVHDEALIMRNIRSLRIRRELCEQFFQTNISNKNSKTFYLKQFYMNMN